MTPQGYPLYAKWEEDGSWWIVVGWDGMLPCVVPFWVSYVGTARTMGDRWQFALKPPPGVPTITVGP